MSAQNGLLETGFDNAPEEERLRGSCQKARSTQGDLEKKKHERMNTTRAG